MHSIRKMRRTGAALLAAALVAVSSCSREGVHKPYVARVGDEELREDDIPSYKDSAVSRESREFINEWIVNELLYQEAVRKGLADSDEIRRLMQETRKRLAVNALLERDVFTTDSSAVNEDAVAAFFNAHATSFALREDVLNASYVMFSDRDAANGFRTKVLRGTSWGDALAQVEQDSSARSHVLGAATRQYFTQDKLYPDELWKLARSLGREEVSFVVKSNAGYYVLKMHGIKRQGEIPDLAYVHDEVRDRLLIEQRRLKYEKLVGDLRNRFPVDIRMDRADTSSAVD